jgi:hypothetical protein
VQAGWEIEDFLFRIFCVLTKPNGSQLNPMNLFLVLGIHHFLTLLLVIPMNLSPYREDPFYHELVLLFQLAAAVAMIFQQYGFTLDLATTKGLWIMILNVTVVWLTVMYTRVYRPFFIFGHFLPLFYQENEMFFFFGGSIGGFFMMSFNTLIFLDATMKVFKFYSIAFQVDKSVPPAEARKILREKSSEALNGATILRHPSSITIVKLTSSQRNWAKVRGVVAVMGSIKKDQKND